MYKITHQLRQEEALISSIHHWKENKRLAKQGKDIDISPSSCACCITWPVCIGCPIAEFVGANGCTNTPYHKIAKQLANHKLPRVKDIKREIRFLRLVLRSVQSKTQRI
jgi:hypothetical protein